MRDYKTNKVTASEAFCQSVYGIVSEIPAGKVTTYGDIASLLGAPQYSRMVGRALKEAPTELDIPCHRVVNAAGRLVPGWEEQKQRLLSEGVSLKADGCVDLKKYKFSAYSLLL